MRFLRFPTSEEVASLGFRARLRQSHPATPITTKKQKPDNAATIGVRLEAPSSGVRVGADVGLSNGASVVNVGVGVVSDEWEGATPTPPIVCEGVGVPNGLSVVAVGVWVATGSGAGVFLLGANVGEVVGAGDCVGANVDAEALALVPTSSTIALKSKPPSFSAAHVPLVDPATSIWVFVPRRALTPPA